MSFDWVARRATWIAVFALALSALAMAQIVDPRSGERRLEVDASANRILPAGGEDREFYDFVRRLFGSDETLLVALSGENLFTVEGLERIARMTRRIERVPGVQRVVSLANALNIRGTEEGLDIGPFLQEGEPIDPERVRREVLDNPIYAGSIVSADASATALLVYFMDIPDSEFLRRGLDQQIAEIAEEERGDLRAWLTGTPFIKAETTRLLLRDLLVLPAGMMLVLGIALTVSLRSARLVFVPLAAVAFSVLLTVALVAAVGISLNVVTVLVPPLLTTIGLAYSVHVVSEFREVLARDPAADRVKAATAALEHVWLPVALTGGTTAAGFASLALSPTIAVREFGILAVAGVVITAGTSLTLTPALLRLLGAGPPRGTPGARPFDRFVRWLARFDAEHRRLIFAVSALIFVVSLAGLARVRISTDYLANLPRESPIRVGFEAINRNLQGANPFYVVVSADYTDALKDPVNLREIESLQRWLERQPEIGGTTSIVDYLKLINRGFHENDPNHLAIPESRRLVSQLIFFGANEEVDRFVDSRFRMAAIMVRARVFDSDAVAVLLDRIEAHLAAALPDHLEGKATGNPVLLADAIDDIMRGQAWSVGGALVVIYGILSAMFLSLRVGFVALIPNLLPVAFYFGVLGLTGVSLNPGTSVIAPMVLGIAVDDTIHYFARFNADARRLADDRAATVSALQSVGRPVTFTSVSLGLGFLVLTTSDLGIVAQVGAMSAVALAFAWVVDMALTPALCSGMRIATLWDALSLDLGESPQKSIPLLAGLRDTQARVVALMSTVVSVEAGERLITEGERGEEMYVVIEGKLRAYTEKNGETRELSTHERGDSIGEVGLFFAKRTANVEAITDARLLRLTQGSLERLGRRYPRIAARVHRNLNDHLAGMVARLTRRLF